MSHYEGASFKDPAGRVLARNGRIFRALTPSGEQLWKDLNSSGLVEDLTARGQLVRTWESPSDPTLGLPLLEHDVIPFLSYVYEWPFALLKEAALLHLNLLESLLAKEFILKDATPFNVQFRGVTPVFIDILSIERRTLGDPWAGYGQFCDTMLYPLMLTAYKNIPHQEWTRGALGGIGPEHFSRIFGGLEFFKAGIPLHVKLRSAFHKRLQNPEQVKRADIRRAQLPVSAILRNVEGLKSLVDNLDRPKNKSHWVSYTETNTYDDASRQAKKSFVERILAEEKPALVWDIGCNTGEFSEIAVRYAQQVVSFDNDEEVVDVLARRLQKQGTAQILPLVMDLCNPSPALGWACRERKSIFERGRPDVIMALALVHHLAVKGNVPLDEQLQLFSTIGKTVILEFVDRTDPMFKRLITNVGIEHDDYNDAEFKRCVGKYFQILASERLSDTREIYALKSKVVASVPLPERIPIETAL